MVPRIAGAPLPSDALSLHSGQTGVGGMESPSIPTDLSRHQRAAIRLVTAEEGRDVCASLLQNGWDFLLWAVASTFAEAKAL